MNISSFQKITIQKTFINTYYVLGSENTKFFKDFIYLFLEREEERGKEKERNIDVREKHQLDASRTFLTGDRTHNSGMCPDQASNWRSLTLRDDAHPTEPYQSGLRIQILIATTAF